MQTISKHRWAGALVLVIALWWTAPMPAHAIPFNPAVEYDATPPGVSSIPNATGGYQFSMSVPFTVDALASWDQSSVFTGFPNPDVQVGLWNSVGTLLVSTTVLGGTDPIQGHFQYSSITPMTLGSGDYTIGGNCATLGCRNWFPVPLGAIVTIPGYAYIGAALDFSGSPGLNYPTSFGDTNRNQFLLPNFSIANAAPVPEPSTILLLASGLAGILGYGWRRKGAA